MQVTTDKWQQEGKMRTQCQREEEGGWGRDGGQVCLMKEEQKDAKTTEESRRESGGRLEEERQQLCNKGTSVVRWLDTVDFSMNSD